jgi:hypothetical protein|tara:strand:+ start:613 stop:840 length:228 start_codon:yes stop_codon:yes gene_type:complete
MTTAVKINNQGLVYSGSYECEGHNVSFIILTGDRVKIIEVNTAGRNTTSTERTEFLENAIEYQDKLIKLGYDKVS